MSSILDLFRFSKWILVSLGTILLGILGAQQIILNAQNIVLNEPQTICLNYVRQEYDKRTSSEDRAPINLMVELKDNCPSF
tara:strand:+ start:2595 stop:2837 length:243 start_codon:yes stop_codon:yes gene_type:complete